MNATLERPAMKPARPVSIKAALVAQIQAAIEAAPGDSAEVARLRKRHHGPLRPKWGLCHSRQENTRFYQWRAAVADTADQLEHEAVPQITFTAGPVSYTVWNTRETLEGFLSRVKRAFP